MLGLPTDKDIEKLLKQNTEHTKPLEYKKYKNFDGEEVVLPFWEPAPYGDVEVSYEYLQFKPDGKGVIEDKKKVGSIKAPKNDDDLITKNFIDTINKVIDDSKSPLASKVNAVIPKSTFTTKKTKNDTTIKPTVTQSVTHKANKNKLVGSIKPKK